MGRRFQTLWVILLTGTSPLLHAQDIQVRGYFRTDSAALGEVIPYVLTAAYPRNMQVLFPDSTISVAPFETVGKKFFPTKSAGDTSRDSAVYFVSTFELDSTQGLRIPVFVLQEQDCLAVFPDADSIHLRYRVKIALDSIPVEKLPLKANTAYQRVRQFLNYPALLIGLAILAAALLGTWILFGKQIRRYFLLRRMKRKYLNFLQRFGGAISRMGPDASSRVAEETLWHWKNYIMACKKL